MRSRHVVARLRCRLHRHEHHCVEHVRQNVALLLARRARHCRLVDKRRRSDADLRVRAEASGGFQARSARRRAHIAQLQRRSGLGNTNAQRRLCVAIRARTRCRARGKTLKRIELKSVSSSSSALLDYI